MKLFIYILKIGLCINTQHNKMNSEEIINILTDPNNNQEQINIAVTTLINRYHIDLDYENVKNIFENYKHREDANSKNVKKFILTVLNKHSGLFTALLVYLNGSTKVGNLTKPVTMCDDRKFNDILEKIIGNDIDRKGRSLYYALCTLYDHYRYDLTLFGWNIKRLIKEYANQKSGKNVKCAVKR